MPSTVVRIYMYLTYLIPEETLRGRYSYSPGGEMGNCSGDGLSNPSAELLQHHSSYSLKKPEGKAGQPANGQWAEQAGCGKGSMCDWAGKHRISNEASPCENCDSPLICDLGQFPSSSRILGTFSLIRWDLSFFI